MKTLTPEELENRVAEIAGHFGAAIDSLKATFPDMPYAMCLAALGTILREKLNLYADVDAETARDIETASNESVARTFCQQIKVKLLELTGSDEMIRGKFTVFGDKIH